jgi:acyl-CoA reductase-like NAD-dependent aldehyde dehydrogenase
MIITSSKCRPRYNTERFWLIVLTLQSFDTEDEAVRLANDSTYGLSACI